MKHPGVCLLHLSGGDNLEQIRDAVLWKFAKHDGAGPHRVKCARFLMQQLSGAPRYKARYAPGSKTQQLAFVVRCSQFNRADRVGWCAKSSGKLAMSSDTAFCFSHTPTVAVTEASRSATGLN